MPDEIGALRSKDAKLYYNTGTRASPTWVLLDAVNVTMPITWSESDVSSRASDYKLMMKALAELGVDFTMIKYAGDAGYVAMEASAYSPSQAHEFAVMSGDIIVAGSRGVRFFGQVFSATDNQQLEEGQTVDFNAKPTRWYESNALAPPLPYIISA